VEKRYLLQAAGANLALVMRALFGLGTPRGWAERAWPVLPALVGSARALWYRWSAHFRSRFNFPRSLAACWPPRADLISWPVLLLARP